MALAIVDYTDLLYGSGEPEPVPLRGKLVVMRRGGERFAVFAPRELAFYHANIVERFLRQMGSGGWYGPKRDIFIPASPDWAIEGGAHWELDREAARLTLGGESIAYGPLDLAALADELRQTRAFDGAAVVVGD